MGEDDSFLVCPRCGHEGRFHRAEIESKNSGLAMLLVSGIWAYLLSQPSDNMYVCDRCHYVFEPDPRFNKWVALFIVILAAIAVVAGLVCVVFQL
jgi:rubredoxin